MSENEQIDWKDVNASKQLFEKLIEFSHFRERLFSKEVEYTGWLVTALEYLANMESYHMRLIIFLMKELADALKISFEDLVIRVYIQDIKEVPDYLVNFNPNKEEEYTVLTLVPNPIKSEEEPNDET